MTADMEKLISDEAHKSWMAQDYTTKLTEQGMQTASIMYPIGFIEGAKWAMEYMKNREEKLNHALSELENNNAIPFMELINK